jgi:alcohol dehydrogenase class IV
VIFGVSSVERLGEEVERLGASRVLVLCTPGQRALAQAMSERLGARAVGIYDRAAMHVPIETAEDARREAARHKADCCVAVGGGSTIGLGKAIALQSGPPILAIPTTYAGSEMTPIWGLTEGGLKKTGRDVRVLPRTVIYDPALTVDLPAAVSGPSGINALAHCVEALYAPDGNPIVSLMAEEGARALAESLPVVVKEPANLGARSRALYGAWLGGSSLGAASTGLHHKLCHTLGGTYNLPHAEVHAVIMPHATRYNALAAPDAMMRLARSLGVADGKAVPSAIYDLVVAVGGALVVPKDNRAEGGTSAGETRRTTQFTPGAPATLRSADGRVQVDFPANAFNRPLTLQHDQRFRAGDNHGRGSTAFSGGFPTFQLDATDTRGNAVHQFSAPLVLKVRYTPEQLQALRIAESDLAISWFDESAPNGGQWRLLETSIDTKNRMASTKINHFSDFALSDGSSPSSAYIPSLQGWQVGLYSGNVTYEYPIDVPAGPGGIRPNLGLSYNSTATDSRVPTATLNFTAQAQVTGTECCLARSRVDRP